MGIFDWLEETGPEDFGSPGSTAITLGRAARDILGNIIGSRGSSSAEANEGDATGQMVPGYPRPPQDIQDRMDYDTAYDKSRKSGIVRRATIDAGMPDPEAGAAGLAIDVAYKQAEIDRMKREADAANSDEAKALLRAQVAIAEKNLAIAEANLEKIKSEMPTRERIQLEHALALSRERLSADIADARSQREINAALAREAQRFSNDMAVADRNFQNQLTRDDRQFGRDLMRDQLSLGVTVRGQELERLKAQDDFVSNMLQNQIASGRLSLDKAAKQFEAYVTKARLPSEIMRNVGQAVEPLLPYMTSMKAGDIPLGFETGGTRDMMGRLGGNAPSSYDQSKYAFKPVEVDPFKLAKQAGADFSQTKVPNPSAVFGGVNVPQVPTGGQSATAGIGPIGQYTGQVAGMQQGILGSASPMPPGVAPTDQERQQLMKGLGG